MHLILGIDPGLSGALAFYDPSTGDLEIHDVPTHTVKSNGTNKRRLDLYQMAILLDAKRNAIKQAIIEAPTSRPGEGVASAFTFGFACGAMQGLVAANIIPMQLVTPTSWKRALRLSSEKDESRALASRLAPLHANQWPLKKHDGRAEAFLLAWYYAHLLSK